MEMDKLSYALGISFGQQIAQANLQISDFQAFAKGLEVSIKGTAPEIDFAKCQQECIHRSVADLRLLATPTSWGRVANPNPN